MFTAFVLFVFGAVYALALLVVLAMHFFTLPSR
jgi:hypothetical protein